MNDKVGEHHARPPAFPENAEGFLEHRKLKGVRTLNDEVEAVYLALAGDQTFKDFIYATYDEMAVEGSLSADNIMAAKMIRDKAIDMKRNEVSKQKLATLSKCLGVVARRYGFSRKERRNMIGGEFVPPDTENNSL